MKMKKLLTMMTVLAILGTMFAGCGQTKDTLDPSEPSGTTVEDDENYDTGDASLDGKRYEFELLASDGSLLEWERD